jgi:hypothetical protein
MFVEDLIVNLTDKLNDSELFHVERLLSSLYLAIVS